MQSVNTTYDIGVRPLGMYQALLKRVFILLVMIDWIWRYYSHLLLHQLAPAPLTRVLYAPTYHLYKLSGLEDVLMGGGAFVFDVLFSILLIWMFVKPLQKWGSVLLFLFISIYAIAYPVHIAFSVHYFAPIWLMSSMLLIQQRQRFEMWWEALRYYACWVYGSAFLWKLWYGAIFEWENGMQVYKSNMAQYLLLNEGHWFAGVYSWVYQHGYLLNIGQYIAFGIEALFIVGFFTKRYDRILLWCIPILHISLYIFVDTLFIESFALCLLFLPTHFWNRISTRFTTI